jgi:chromosome segregation ATPase
MFKKITVGVVLALACRWVVRKTELVSYGSTLIARGKESVRKQIPRDLELARAQHEIQQLDRDYRGLLGPIAEKMAAVKRLEREISTAQDNLQLQRDHLLALTQAVETKQTQITCDGNTYSLDHAKVKLARDFATFKKLETHLASKEKLLDAETKNLTATRDQLDKLMTQKREFEIRVAQLDAEEAALKVARIKTPLQSDNGRVASIKKTLDRIEHGQTVEQYQHQLQQQYGTKIGDAQPSVSTTTLDLNEIRDYLEGRATSTAKSGQSK